MDEEFQKSLRALQRVGGTFDRLNLHNYLDQGQLDDLIKHAVIAKMRRAGFELVQLSSLMPATDSGILFPGEWTSPHTITDTSPQQFVESYSIGATKLRQVDSFEDFPSSVIKYIWENWKEINGRVSRSWVQSRPNDNRTPRFLRLVRSGLRVGIFNQQAHVTYLWTEDLNQTVEAS